MLEKIKRFGWGYLLIGVALIGIGLSLIIFKDMLANLALAVGITLTVYGILYGVVTYLDKTRNIFFALKIALSVACIIGGVITVLMREGAVGIIIDISCLLLIIDGAFKLRTALDKNNIGAAMMWVMLVLSLVTIIPSFVIVKVIASSGSFEAGWIIGLIIIIDGAANILTPFIKEPREGTPCVSDEVSGGMEKEAVKNDK